MLAFYNMSEPTLEDILTINDDEKSFSGFSSVSEDEPRAHKKKSKPKRKTKTQQKSKSSNKKSTFDINNPNDITILREALGISPSLNKFSPNLRVQIDRNDISDSENMPLLTLPSCSSQIGDNIPEYDIPGTNDVNFGQALFGDVDNDQSQNDDEASEWELPRLKIPEKDKPVASSLAKMLNLASTSQCDIEPLVLKHKIPENCSQACPPLVNNEIWKAMNKRAQTQDRGIVETQNLVSTAMVPIIKLAELLKSQISANSEAKGLMSDALTLLGQIQFSLSVRRRYLIRPTLKKKYHSLCNVSSPITGNLFGDDLTKDIKACDALTSLGNEYTRYNNNFRGRKYNKRGNYNNYGYNSGQSQYSQRYQPYGRGTFRQPYKNYRGSKKGSATATLSTAPNDA